MLVILTYCHHTQLSCFIRVGYKWDYRARQCHLKQVYDIKSGFVLIEGILGETFITC